MVDLPTWHVTITTCEGETVFSDRVEAASSAAAIAFAFGSLALETEGDVELRTSIDSDVLAERVG